MKKRGWRAQRMLEEQKYNYTKGEVPSLVGEEGYYKMDRYTRKLVHVSYEEFLAECKPAVNEKYVTRKTNVFSEMLHSDYVQ